MTYQKTDNCTVSSGVDTFWKNWKIEVPFSQIVIYWMSFYFINFFLHKMLLPIYCCIFSGSKRIWHFRWKVSPWDFTTTKMSTNNAVLRIRIRLIHNILGFLDPDQQKNPDLGAKYLSKTVFETLKSKIWTEKRDFRDLTNKIYIISEWF